MLIQNSEIKTQNHNLKPKISLQERTYKLSLKTITYINSLRKDISSEIIGKQLLRSITSIGANIIEARASSSKRDFTNFFNHSLKSANESLYWLRLLQDSIPANNSEISQLIQETEEISKILGASLLTLKGKKRF